MMNEQNTGLMVIDVQGKLAQVVENSHAICQNIETLIQGCQILKLPIVWLEHQPEKLGSSIPSISTLLGSEQPIYKSTFSACANDIVIDELNKHNRQNWLVCGIETHICVYQTVMGLIDSQLTPHLVVDATSSRNNNNKHIAIQKLQQMQVSITSLEMCLYELLFDSNRDEFRDILKLIK